MVLSVPEARPLNVIVPLDVILDAPLSIFPNPDVIDPLFNTPTVVNDDVNFL